MRSERVAHLGLLLRELALVGEHLPGRPRVRRGGLHAVRAGGEQLHRVGLGEGALRLGHARPHQIAGHAAAHEHHVAVGAGHPGPTVGERVDLELELLAALESRHPSFDSMALRTVLRFALRRS